MSSWPIPSALDASTQAFPVLTAAQITRLRPGGKSRKVEPNEILFQPDDTQVPFFARFDYRGSRTVRPCRGRLRSFGRSRYSIDRNRVSGRAGWIKLHDRELPRFSHWDLRTGIGIARDYSGAEIWRENDGGA